MWDSRPELLSQSTLTKALPHFQGGGLYRGWSYRTTVLAKAVIYPVILPCPPLSLARVKGGKPFTNP